MKPLLNRIASPALRTFGSIPVFRGIERAGGFVGHHPWPFAGGTALLIAGISSYLLLRRGKRPTAEEIERLRREHLATHGRIVAGTLLDEEDTEAIDVPPTTLFYRYSIGGVEYSCAQDLSTLPIPVDRLRLDLPIQIRYDSRNPGDSIVAAEHWNGLCL